MLHATSGRVCVDVDITATQPQQTQTKSESESGGWLNWLKREKKPPPATKTMLAHTSGRATRDRDFKADTPAIDDSEESD